MKTTMTLVLLLTYSILLAANSCFADVAFYKFTYEGKDAVFAQPPEQGQFQNPILAGFYPDPSITRAGDDYYLVTSSFSYSPGIPIFQSKDLVNWKSLGHVLINTKQLPLYNQPTSRGIYAPTIRYHNGTFYVITTLVDVRGNFIVTAKNPAGPWSDPILLPEVGGIDPDIFFDDDGRVYIAHNDAPVGEPLYEGHRAIWLWEYDLKTKKVIKDSHRMIVNGGTDLSKKPVWIEAPHIYKINGWYYLLCAEGGTGYEHSEVAFRTRDLKKPFEPYSGNPILTQRDLDVDRPNPVTTAGHADLIQTKEGEWWAVFLATRAYDKKLYNTGRETFLLPVTWKNEWPIILEQGKNIPYQLGVPRTLAATKNTEPTTGNFIWQDTFSSKALQHQWVSLRSADSPFYKLKKNRIQLRAKTVGLNELEQPAFLGRRQQHTRFSASAEFQIPQAKSSAGIAALQSETAHYYFGARLMNGKTQLFIEQANKGLPNIIHTLFPGDIGKRLTLIIEGDGGEINFYYQDKNGAKKTVLENADAKILSTEVAGGFVGTLLGIHARAEQ